MKIHEYLLVLICMSGCLCNAQDHPVDADSIRVNLENTIGTITYEGQTRTIFNNNQVGAVIKSAYEPAFFPAFNKEKSAAHKLVITVLLDTKSYNGLAATAATSVSRAPTIRLPITGAMITLGPIQPTEPPYSFVAPKQLLNDNFDSFEVVFDVPATTPDEVAAFARESSLRVAYGVLSTKADAAITEISLEVKNTSVFSNKINGPVESGKAGDMSVSVTRNQLADAISRGWIAIVQNTQGNAGAQSEAELSRDEANKLLPILINQLAFQQKPANQVMDELANFSFNGDDAGARINSYLNKLATTVKLSSSDHVNVNAGAEASVLGLFSGKVNAVVDKDHKQDSLDSKDATLNWSGEQIIPASLNVMTIRTANLKNVASLTAQESMVVGKSSVSRSLSVPILGGAPAIGEWSSTPIGAVVPFFLTAEEIAALAPNWIPADGRILSDPSSPLDRRKLPNLVDSRVVVGASPVANVVNEDSRNVGGSRAFSASVSISGSTSEAQFPWGIIGMQAQNHAPAFVIDTTVNETQSARHNHSFSGSGSFTATLPLPPFRQLIYMVRCRY